MKPYPAYKDSGIEWVGEIPEHWTMRKISHSFNLIGSGTTPKADNPEYYDNGNINWIITGDLNDSILKEASKKITNKALEDCSSLKTYPKGTLLIAMYGATIGKIAMLDIEGCTNQACCALSDSHCLTNDFTFYWFLANKPNIISLSVGGGQPNISQEIIRSLRIPTPTLSEQESIIKYLNHKTSQIDTLIDKKQKQIELLKEERTAIINQAVTKGFNPDVPMKDSGIEWLGKVPKHWETNKISHITTKITNGYVGPTRDILMENGIRYLQSLHIKNNEISFNPPYYVSQKWSNMHKRSILEKGDVLVVQTGDIGQVAVVKEDFAGCNCHALIILTPDGTNVNGEYLSMILNSNYGYHTLKSIQTGALHPHLNSSNVKDIQVPLPPLKEQFKIMEFLHNYSTINSISVKTIQQQITFLQEYRTALISEAVTGKIDLRDTPTTSLE